MDVPIENFSQALSDRLRQTGLLSGAGLTRAEALAESEGWALDRAVIHMGLAEEAELLPVVADLLCCRAIREDVRLSTDNERLHRLTPAFCAARIICPVLDESGQQLLLTADPGNAALVAEVSFHLDGAVTVAAASTRLIRGLLADAVDMTGQEGSDLSSEQREADVENARRAGADGPVIRFVSEKLNEAVSLGASDVHFEAQEDGLRVRYRVRGVLKPQAVDRSLSMASVLARIKVLAGMSVSERRLPQDGRITGNVAGRKVDFRVSSIPTSFGESIVCRVLDPASLRLGWEKLGFDAALTDRIRQIIEQPSGLFLVTGPTGAGKTTTLYTALSQLNRDDRKIVTIEDPIEYNLQGIEQVQVHEEIGMTFATALRSFLRQDPNIIMVGEIRDQETAEIACRAALVGRLVLSTLHTSSPQGAVTRLVDLGVPEFIVHDVLRGVLGQRLRIAEGTQTLEAELFMLPGK